MNNELKLFRIPESHRAFKLMLESAPLALAVWSGACSRNLPPVSQAKASPPAVTASSDGGLFDEGAADHTECALKRDFKNAHPTAAELVAGLGISDAQIVLRLLGTSFWGRDKFGTSMHHQKREYLHIVIRQNNQLQGPVSLTLKEEAESLKCSRKGVFGGPDSENVTKIRGRRSGGY